MYIRADVALEKTLYFTLPCPSLSKPLEKPHVFHHQHFNSKRGVAGQFLFRVRLINGLFGLLLGTAVTGSASKVPLQVSSAEGLRVSLFCKK